MYDGLIQLCMYKEEPIHWYISITDKTIKPLAKDLQIKCLCEGTVVEQVALLLLKWNKQVEINRNIQTAGMTN